MKTFLLIKGACEIIIKKTEGEGAFFGMLLDYFGASLLWNMLAGKDLIRVGEGSVRTGQNFSCHLIV